MNAFIRVGGKMLGIHKVVTKQMPSLLAQRGRWSCHQVRDKHSPFTYMRLSYDEGNGAELKGIDINGERFVVLINNFARTMSEQALHNHRGMFASWHFHPDLALGAPVVRHHWNTDGGSDTEVEEFSIGDAYAIENYAGVFHRVEPLVDEYFTLLVALIAKDAREPNVTLVPQRVPEALRMFAIVERQFDVS